MPLIRASFALKTQCIYSLWKVAKRASAKNVLYNGKKKKYMYDKKLNTGITPIFFSYNSLTNIEKKNIW
jgi:hypothetical protein